MADPILATKRMAGKIRRFSNDMIVLQARRENGALQNFHRTVGTGTVDGCQSRPGALYATSGANGAVKVLNRTGGVAASETHRAEAVAGALCRVLGAATNPHKRTAGDTVLSAAIYTSQLCCWTK